MFKLAKLAILFVMFLGFVAFGFLVKLGDKTLFGHVAAIGKSKESQELVRGTKEAAQPIVDRVRQVAAHIAPPDGGTRDGGTDAARSKPMPPADKLTDDDRAKLRRVLSGANVKKKK